jgi:hypothetical protein
MRRATIRFKLRAFVVCYAATAGAQPDPYPHIQELGRRSWAIEFEVAPDPNASRDAWPNCAVLPQFSRMAQDASALSKLDRALPAQSARDRPLLVARTQGRKVLEHRFQAEIDNWHMNRAGSLGACLSQCARLRLGPADKVVAVHFKDRSDKEECKAFHDLSVPTGIGEVRCRDGSVWREVLIVHRASDLLVCATLSDRFSGASSAHRILVDIAEYRTVTIAGESREGLRRAD